MKTSCVFINKLDAYFSSYFKDKKYFVCIYGSYANGHADKASDVDMFVASNNLNIKDIESIKTFVIDFHRQNHLSLDNEVPYDVKLLVDYEDIENAINLNCFVVDENGQITIPKIEKTKEFLGSYNVKLRLILNALSSPHIFLGNDKEKYSSYKEKAERAVYKLATNLVQKGSQFTAKELVNVLLNSANDEDGELYLGYKKYKSVKKYLVNLINKHENKNDSQL